jgi:Domain of unknown function (DUF4440)
MDLDEAIGQYHQSANAFAEGDPEPVEALFSDRDDIMLANPFGPAVFGRKKVAEALEYASSRFRDGEVTAFEGIARYVTTDLASIHELERWRAKVAGREEMSEFNLRVTSTFRLPSVVKGAVPLPLRVHQRLSPSRSFVRWGAPP